MPLNTITNSRRGVKRLRGIKVIEYLYLVNLENLSNAYTPQRSPEDIQFHTVIKHMLVIVALWVPL